MLRVHFTAEDLAGTRLRTSPDPLWEITTAGASRRGCTVGIPAHCPTSPLVAARC